MSDYLAFYDSAVLLGSGIYKSLYPLPFVYFTMPITQLSPFVGYILLSIISIVLLVIKLKRSALLWIFYVPLLQTIYLGQVDVVFWFLLESKNPYLWALASMKPQFLPFIVYNLYKSRKDIWKFIIGMLLLYAPFFIIRPMWVMEWTRQLDDGRLGNNNSASFWAFGGLFLLLLPLLIIKAKNYKGLFLSLNPAVRPYDYSLLIGGHLLLIPLSWILMIISNQIQADWLISLLGVANVFFLWKKVENNQTLSTSQILDYN